MDQFEKKLYGITKIETKNVQYTWKVCNFSSICKENGEFFSSSIFTHSENEDVKWCLNLYPNGFNKYYEDCVSLFLKNVGGCDENNKLHVQISFSIVNSKQEEKFVHSTKLIYSQPIGYGFAEFVKADYIKDKANGLLVNDILIIVCKMKVGGDGRRLTCQEEAEDCQSSVVPNYSQFSDNLSLLLDDKEFTDVTLVARDKEFQVHKAILAAQSSVFMAMFKTDMKEKKENRVEVTDFDSNVISAMLHYVYTGKVKKVDDYSFDLLKIADKYAIDGLKSMSETMLHNKLNINNVIETLVTADNCNCQGLKTKVIKFIIAHKHAVFRLQAFETLKKCNPHLIVDMFCDIITSN